MRAAQPTSRGKTVSVVCFVSFLIFVDLMFLIVFVFVCLFRLMFLLGCTCFCFLFVLLFTVLVLCDLSRG